jgi:hypothetical protein
VLSVYVGAISGSPLVRSDWAVMNNARASQSRLYWFCLNITLPGIIYILYSWIAGPLQAKLNLRVQRQVFVVKTSSSTNQSPYIMARDMTLELDKGYMVS